MKKITFAIPEGFVPPEGLKDGAEFDSAATFKLENGKLCIVAVDGVPMKGYEKEAEEGRKSNEGTADDQTSMASRYAAAMQQAEAGQMQQPMSA